MLELRFVILSGIDDDDDALFMFSIRCQRETFTCAQGDADCLYAPLSYSVNIITLPLSVLRVPVDLFTMRGPATPHRRLQFELKLLKAYDPTTADQETRINEAFFDIEQVLKRSWPRNVVTRHLLGQRLSICPSVRPSHSWFTPNMFKISKYFFVFDTVAPNFIVQRFTPNICVKERKRTPVCSENFTNALWYLGNGARYELQYSLILSRMVSFYGTKIDDIEWPWTA